MAAFCLSEPWTYTEVSLSTLNPIREYIKEKEDSNTICYLETLAKSSESSENLLFFPGVQQNATNFGINKNA